jgi:hypothetical protein
MFGFAAIALVAAATLPWAAVGIFRWSVRAARMILNIAAVTVVLGGLTTAAVGRSALTVCVLIFSWAGCACCVIAVRHLRDRSERWIHRFVIYAGYGATFAAMSAASVGLSQRPSAPWLAAVVLVGAWVLGSVCVFVAKTLTVRLVAKAMPDYMAALGADPSGGYW